MKRNRYKLGGVLLLVLLISISTFPQTETAPRGSGTASNPYLIESLDNLAWLQDAANNAAWKGSYFKQTADIDASSSSGWDSGNGFSPIGSYTNNFTGTYDGDGHTISGLYISRSGTNSVGLFGFCNGAVIKNLGVINETVIGNQHTGGLAGLIEYSDTVSQCYTTGKVNGYQVGGLVGYSNYSAVISNCYSTDTVSHNVVGGLVGWNNNSSVIINSYGVGPVTTTGTIGGLVGNSTNSAVAESCFWDTTTSGQSTSAGGTGESTAEMQDSTTFINAGWDFSNIWKINQNINSGYPYLAWQKAQPSGTNQSVMLTIVQPRYHHAFYSSYNLFDIVASFVVLPHVLSNQGALIKLTTKEDSTVDDTLLTFLSDTNFVQFPSSTVGPGDTLILSGSLINSAGAVIATADSGYITRFPPNSNEVVVRQDGVTLVNGHPFFPIGIFAVPAQDFDYVKGLGFNTIGYVNTNDLSAARNAGLKALANIPRTEWGDSLQLQSSSQTNAHYSSLLAEYYYDEPKPTNATWEQLREVSNIMTAADPYHLTTGVNAQYESYYAGISDVMMVDGYPINYPWKGYSFPGEIINRLGVGLTAMKGKGPVWSVPQAFPWQPYFSRDPGFVPDWNRPPTYTEERALTWMPICMGAQGIVYYAYTIQGFYVRNAYPRLWKSLTYVVAELDTLQNVLTSQETAPSFSTTDTTIFTTSKQFNGASYFFAVNSDSIMKVIDFDVPVNITSLNVISENRTVQVTDGTFADTLQPSATHLYTTSSAYAYLPSIEDIDTTLANTPSGFQKNDLTNVNKGARLKSSWGFDTTALHWFWYKMIDADEWTPWLLPTTAPGQWVEIDLPSVDTVSTITVVSGGLLCHVEVYVDSAWSKEPFTDVIPANSIHYIYQFQATNYQTAIFSPVLTNKIRIVFDQNNQPAPTYSYPVFEIEAYSSDVKPTGVQAEPGQNVPRKYKLYQNYPNPFNPTTMIQYDIPKASHVSVKIYDILGREVQTLVNARENPGKYSVEFNGSRFASGVYFVRFMASSVELMSTGTYTKILKMVLVK